MISILTVEEVQHVVSELRRKSKRSKSTHLNLTIFRLATGVGLRRCEIIGLNLNDLILTGPQPCVRVRKEVTKGQNGKKRARIVPFWDGGTLEDVRHWVKFRMASGAKPEDPVCCTTYAVAVGKRLGDRKALARWKTAIKCLGPERVKQLYLHTGRHTFCSHSLAAGHGIASVRDAMGHRSIHTTSIYAHIVEKEQVPDLYPITGR